jgi:hypothetical protein
MTGEFASDLTTIYTRGKDNWVMCVSFQNSKGRLLLVVEII